MSVTIVDGKHVHGRLRADLPVAKAERVDVFVLCLGTGHTLHIVRCNWKGIMTGLLCAYSALLLDCIIKVTIRQWLV